MKYIVVIGDGMVDEPLAELNGETPLQKAKTPHMDFIAKNGSCGMLQTVPSGMEPGSDVANLSIMGYDPKEYYTGRGPLEAASIGATLKEDDVAFRCNLITQKNGLLADFNAGHISTVEAAELAIRSPLLNALLFLLPSTGLLRRSSKSKSAKRASLMVSPEGMRHDSARGSG
jgi:Predicted phosphoglycerate mutase, AP superfamily